MKTLQKNTYYQLSILLLLGLVVGVYFWQHGQVNNLKKQNTALQAQVNNLKASNSNIKQQSSSLSAQLNKANQSVSQLSQSSSFVAGAACQTQQLALVEEKNLGGAAGTTGEIFSYQNTSNSPCVVNGYPGFLALDSTSHVMPNGPVQTGTVISSKGPQPITIAPSAKAYFAVDWHFHDTVGTENGCIQPSLIESTPPGNLLPLAIATSDLGYMCSGVTVSPLGNLSDF